MKASKMAVTQQDNYTKHRNNFMKTLKMVEIQQDNRTKKKKGPGRKSIF